MLYFAIKKLLTTGLNPGMCLQLSRQFLYAQDNCCFMAVPGQDSFCHQAFYQAGLLPGRPPVQLVDVANNMVQRYLLVNWLTNRPVFQYFLMNDPEWPGFYHQPIPERSDKQARCQHFPRVA